MDRAAAALLGCWWSASIDKPKSRLFLCIGLLVGNFIDKNKHLPFWGQVFVCRNFGLLGLRDFGIAIYVMANLMSGLRYSLSFHSLVSESLTTVQPLNQSALDVVAPSLSSAFGDQTKLPTPVPYS